MLNKARRFVGKMKLKAIANAPELYLAAGTILIAGGIVTACRATLKADDILDDLKGEIDKINETRELAVEYMEKSETSEDKYPVTMMAEDLKNTKIQHSVSIVKEFAIPAVMIAAGFGCLYRGHFVLKDRYLGMTAAYESVKALFRQYRDRVVADQGLEADQKYLFGTKECDVVTMNADGTVGEVVKAAEADVKATPGVMLFDSYSRYFVKDRTANAMKVASTETWANQQLYSRGWVLLSEVLEHLDMPMVPHANCFGWVFGGEGDNRVDLRAVVCPGTCVYEVEIDPNFDGDISKIIAQYDRTH